MAASDHLHPKQFMYHHSPARNRSSIKRRGLLPKNPFDPNYHQSVDEAPIGVYLAPDRDTSHTLVGHDLWRIDVSGVALHHDPDDPNEEWGFKYSPTTIPRERVRLAKKAVKR